MSELFTKAIEQFIEKAYETDAVVFQEVILEHPMRSLISLCYYWHPTLETDMYELVYAAKNDTDGLLYCESVGKFPQASPKLEEIAKVIQRLLYTYV